MLEPATFDHFKPMFAEVGQSSSSSAESGADLGSNKAKLGRHRLLGELSPGHVSRGMFSEQALRGILERCHSAIVKQLVPRHFGMRICSATF